MKQDSFNSNDKILQLIAEEQEEPHAHKPFMTKVPIKQTPIGYEFHQVEVPDFQPSKALKPSFQRKILWSNIKINASPAVYLKSNTKQEEVLKYLLFIENYFEQKIPDYFTQISKQRTRSMALRLLHECDYNYTKAKFFILFPYYKTYNKFRCHQPLRLSDDEMEHKINVHIESLKSSKENDLMKWVKTIQNQMESRIHISKINTYIQIAKHNKFDIPDNIKDIIERSAKIGKQLKKNILNSKNTLQKLQSIKTELQDHKIVTNQMIHFEQALTRAEEWIKKQNKFQQEYFYEDNEDLEKSFTLKEKQFFREFGKIQFRLLQSLVNEYNSLPLHYPSFAKTTLILYEETNKLITQIPSLSKSAKTRKSEQGNGIVKLPRRLIAQILSKISQIPVQHEDFISFQYTITDGLEQIQRISMFLQDTKFQKNIKNLNLYQKLISDIPIENDVQRKLNQKIQYYELIDRIKKDISNPAKYDSLKDQLMKLKQKGYQNLQHAKLEARVMACMGWHESQQLIKEEKKIPNRIFLILNEKYIKMKMIKFQTFQAQLLIARNQLNISEDILKQSQMRLQAVSQLRQKILNILDEQEPVFLDFIDVFKECYENGISFLEFDQLYQKLITIQVLVAKIHYLLNTSEEPTQKIQIFYFTNNECEKIIQFICENKNQIKDLRTKQTGDQIIQTINNMNFPKNLPEWIIFQEFMKKAQEWSDRALKIIEDFKNNDNMYNTRQVIEQSRYCLHSKQIQEELNRIQIALKWRQKIARKMSEDNSLIFDQNDHIFMTKLEKDLQIQQTNFCYQEQMKDRALTYMYKNKRAINSILQKIADFQIQKLIVLKLSQMNKFVKEIDRQIQKYNIKDKVINQLKIQLQIELVVNQDWKQRYLAVKRFQKKKIGVSNLISAKQSCSKKKDDQEFNDNDISFDLMKDQKEEENFQNYCVNGYIPKAMQIPYSPVLLSRPDQFGENAKKKYIIKNGQFCWYFRMLLLIFEFYNGCKLKFVVQQFLKLKSTLTDVYRLIEKYNIICNKSDRTDADFQFLDAQACKVPVFFRESYLVTAKYAKIISWKNLAQPILRSVPVINMQLKARKVQQLRDLIQKKKNEQLMQQHKITQEQTNQITNKRRRKPNQLYQNDDITLFRDDFLISKNKKRKTNKSTNGNQNTESGEYRNSNNHTSLNYKKSKTDKYRNHQRQRDYQRDCHSHRQTLEHLQHLILHSQNADLIIDDPKLYCICRNGVPNENSLMVMCENCQQWFHIECVGIKKHQAKNQDNYLCVGCRSLEQKGNQQNLGYFWDYYKKVSQYSLFYIYEEGKNLGVIMNQQKKIAMVYNAMIKWKDQTANLLKKLIEQNPMYLKPYEEQIYPLYLQSMWLPTVHHESIYLKRLMIHIRNS